MIAIDAFYTYFDNFLNRVSVDEIEYISTEEEIASLKESDGTKMIVVLPSVIPSSKNIDTCRDINASLILILQKTDSQELDADTKKAMFLSTQTITIAIREELKKDTRDYSGACHFMHGLDLESLIIDPIANYKGWLGWSLAFQFKQ